MRTLDAYVTAAGKRLRCGYTTGTCAAAASRAATELLLAGRVSPAIVVSTPAGVDVTVEVEEAERGEGWARCAVRKDAGDDPDVTDGVLVHARVSLETGCGVRIDGGCGVGRVTRAGLDQPVGAAAINSVPRKMIAQCVQEAADAVGYEGGLAVEISIPAGVELAGRTFNPRLGIVGGISVLGTSGIVRPMSEEALISSIKLELSVLREAGTTSLLLVPGNYGRDFATGVLELSDERMAFCSNYLGESLDEAALLGYGSVLVVGHMGKMAKVAAGVMNTHSRVADCRVETLAAHAAMAGATRELVVRIMCSPTTDAALDALDREGLRDAVMASLMDRMALHLRHRVGGRLDVEAVVFSRVHGLLGMTSGAEALLERHARREVGA